jgi:hypothetical protein
MLDELYRPTVGRIADQDVAAGWAARHREKVEHRRIWAAAIYYVAGVHRDPAGAHRENQISLAARRLADAVGHARQQRFTFEQRGQRDSRRIKQIEPTNGEGSTE